MVPLFYRLALNFGTKAGLIAGVRTQKGAKLHRICASLFEDLDYSVFFPALLALAHRALANAANLALPAAVNLLLDRGAGSVNVFSPLSFAHLALAAAAMAARPAALILRRGFVDGVA